MYIKYTYEYRLTTDMYIKLYIEKMLLYYSDNGMVQFQSSAATCTYETKLHIN